MGKRIAQARKEIENANGIKRNDFAESLGISPRTLTNYEKGHKGPDAEFLMLLCDLYNINLRWLLHGLDDMFCAKPSPEGIAEEVRLMSVEDVLATHELVGRIMLTKVRDQIKQ